MQSNLAVFYQKLKNGQFQRSFPIPNPPFFASTLDNAAASRAYGAEVEFRWQATPELMLDLSGAYLNSKFTDFFSTDPLAPNLFGPGGNQVAPSDLSGNYTRMSPKWVFNFNPTYRIPLDSGANVQLGTNIAYRAKQYHTEFNDDRLAQELDPAQLRTRQFGPERGLRLAGMVALFARTFLELFIACPRQRERRAHVAAATGPALAHAQRLAFHGHYPTLPSSEMPSSFCASTANSIGSCCSTSLAKPLTMRPTASSVSSPRCCA